MGVLRRLVVLTVATAVAVLLIPAAASARAVERLPIIYVASAIENPALSEAFAAPMRARGYEVYTFQTTDPEDPANNPYVRIKGNAAKLGRWADALSKRTGHRRFDVVAISQTGIVSRYWFKDYGGARLVRKAVILSGMILGSPYQSYWLRQGKCPPADRMQYLPPRYRGMNPTPACLEQAMGGADITALNTPTQALPGITYYNVTTLREEEAAPFWINLMTGPGDYRNIVTQDLCPNDPIVHTTLNIAPSMWSLIDSLLRTGTPRMSCMTPSAPAIKVRPVRAPSGIPLPPGTVMPAQFEKYYR
ncbi:lipase [Gordonia sp. (in: high G+C Gram-positive bacteria)]|uniref:esterase/lipase family protein n=1 Tax=Gordonia sp. (in: high G+C Gram-positive bacteria) TaxID=84139 RepID=UPI002635CC00|nr:lipase [Gordonia sp. (in: high G+C Gram-positive bacteria)]